MSVVWRKLSSSLFQNCFLIGNADSLLEHFVVLPLLLLSESDFFCCDLLYETKFLK